MRIMAPRARPQPGCTSCLAQKCPGCREETVPDNAFVEFSVEKASVFRRYSVI